MVKPKWPGSLQGQIMESSPAHTPIKHFTDDETRAVKKLFSTPAKPFDFLSYLISQYTDIDEVDEERIAEIVLQGLKLKVSFLFQMI